MIVLCRNQPVVSCYRRSTFLAAYVVHTFHYISVWAVRTNAASGDYYHGFRLSIFLRTLSISTNVKTKMKRYLLDSVFWSQGSLLRCPGLWFWSERSLRCRCCPLVNTGTLPHIQPTTAENSPLQKSFMLDMAWNWREKLEKVRFVGVPQYAFLLNSL